MNQTILLVEDEAIIAMEEKRLLEHNGYMVLTANNGPAAIEIALREPVDLILMDIDLGSGKMDGTEAARLIREKKDIPVLFMSSHTEPEIVEKTEKITSYGYVVKTSGETVVMTSIKMAFKLHAAQKEIRDSEHRYYSLYDNMSEGVALHEMVYDTDGTAIDYRILDVNRSFEKITGIPKADAVGRLATELYGSTPPPYIDIYAKAAATDDSTHFEVYYPPMDKHFFISVLCPERGQFATVFFDMTERKRIEEELIRNKRLLSQSQQIAKNGAWEYDVDQKRLSWSEEVFRLHELDPKTYDPNDIEQDIRFYTEKDREKIETAFTQAVREGVPYDLELQLQTARGRQLWVRTVGKPEIIEGRVVRVSGNIMDISEQKQIQDNLQKANVKLEKALQEKNLLIREMNHRVKNTLDQ